MGDAKNYTEVIEWMNRLIENYKENKTLSCFNGDICTSFIDNKQILITEGIDILSDIVGEPLYHEPIVSEYASEMVWFSFNGFHFISYVMKGDKHDQQRRV